VQNIQWHIGCSGFSYKEWKEEFYPKNLAQTKWFDYYTKHFDTLELNVTFYRFPTLKSLKAWYDKAPEGFSFSAKVPRPVTHFKKFEETERMINDFYQLLKEGLKEKLGCILFQLPPRLNYSKEKLDVIIKHTNLFFQNVIEFRHNSWWRKDVFETLEHHNITFCGVSYPGIINDVITHGKLCYYRFHGVPKLYHSMYGTEFLKKISDKIIDSNTETAYIYFNNTASAAALENAAEIKNMVGLTSVS